VPPRPSRAERRSVLHRLVKRYNRC
jgi:hypothetical protein